MPSCILRAGWALPVLAAAGLLACGGPRDAELLQLHRVAADRVGRSDPLRVLGEGFPTGRDCVAQFRGRAHRPGGNSRKVQHAVACRAVSSTQVELSALGPDFDQVGGHGTFEGALKIAFVSQVASRRVTGTLAEVRIDLVEATEDALPRSHAHRIRAEELLDFVGLTLARDQPTDGGLVVAWARADSRAAFAGLRQGDRIVQLGGAGIHSLADFVPARGARQLDLHVKRGARRAPLQIQIPLAGLLSPDFNARMLQFAALSLALLLWLLLLSPAPSVAAWLADGRIRRTDVEPTGLWGQPLRCVPSGAGWIARASNWALRWSWTGAVAAVWVGLVFLEPLSGLQFNSLPVYLAFGAGCFGLTLVLRSGEPLWGRTRGALRQLLQMLVLALVILCACALSGTRSLEGIVADQGGLPWQWAVFTRPALFVALVLYVAHGAHGPRLPARHPVLSQAVEISGRVLFSGIGAAIFLGGWQHSGLIFSDGLDPRWVGAVAFVAKTFGFGWLLKASASGARDALSPRLTGALAVAMLALSALWLVFSVGPATEAITGHVLFSAVFLAFGVSALQLRLTRHPLGEPPVYANPF